MSVELLSDEELAALDDSVEAALASGDESGLHVLGYGEIALVLGWPTSAPVVACKRLPVFHDADRCNRMVQLIDDTIVALRERGVGVVPTELRTRSRPDGTISAYAIQPVLPTATLVPNVLRAADPSAEHPVVDAIVGTIERALDARIGLDAQASNWVWDGTELGYLDITTPFVRDANGRSSLDLDLLTTSLPWPLRAPVKRFVLPDVLARYHELRPTCIDLCGNLLKERLDEWVPVFMDAANRHGADPPIDVDAVRKYYRSDARLWRVMLAVRRADRWWQRTIRRRPYPFLLPGHIDR